MVLRSSHWSEFMHKESESEILSCKEGLYQNHTYIIKLPVFKWLYYFCFHFIFHYHSMFLMKREDYCHSNRNINGQKNYRDDSKSMKSNEIFIRNLDLASTIFPIFSGWIIMNLNIKNIGIYFAIFKVSAMIILFHIFFHFN